MDLNARKDHFSRAVVRAVAATAGVKATVPEHDENSVDITFTAPDTNAAPGTKLDAQLKCSQTIKPQAGSFTYPLPVKNYNDLRFAKDTLYVPRILIVVHVPADPAEWLVGEPEKMTLKRCAYWASLEGADPTSNTSTVSVKISTEHVFDPSALLAQLALPGCAL
jgi:hypothetical protein